LNFYGLFLIVLGGFHLVVYPHQNPTEDFNNNKLL